MKQVVVQAKSKEVGNEARLLGLPLFEDLGEVPTVSILSKEDESRVLASDLGDRLLLEFPDQRIIPLENLIAELKGRTEIFVKVRNATEARTALETLELGADGIVLETDDTSQLALTMKAVSRERTLKLQEVEVTRVQELGIGARACVDTCDIMERGEGILVGSSSQGMFLIHAEVEGNTFVAPRPFRINAGAVSLYTLTPDSKTRYLEELTAGDEVLIVGRGPGIMARTRTRNIARLKIELRPLILVEGEYDGKDVKAVLQNAETVRLVSLDGSIPVTELKIGDKVMGRFESGGRHFGTKVEEEQVIER